MLVLGVFNIGVKYLILKLFKLLIVNVVLCILLLFKLFVCVFCVIFLIFLDNFIKDKLFVKWIVGMINFFFNVIVMFKCICLNWWIVLFI